MDYRDSNRGSIQFRDRAKQILSFKGLVFNRITPTDIDGLIEYHNRAFVLFEAKYNKSSLPYGQRLALTRLVDSIEVTKPCILCICTHYVENPEQDVDAASMDVKYIYMHKHWYHGSSNLFNIVKWFLNKADTS